MWSNITPHSPVSLLGRYASVLTRAWRDRKLAAAEHREKYELDFLPAHLELVERPVHPVAQWSMRAVVGLVLATVVLGFLGRLDIIAIAPGKLIPNGNVKIIQPAVTGVVREIRVQNGDSVVSGQVLVKLDASQAAFESDRTKAAHLDTLLTIARVQALLAAQRTGTIPRVSAVVEATPERQSQTQAYAEGAYKEYRGKMAELESEMTKRQAELAATGEEVAKLEQTTPIARQQASDYKALLAQKYVASHDYLDKERAAIEDAQELAAQRSHVQELTAGIEEHQHEIDTAVETFRRELYAELDKAEVDAKQQQDEEAKAGARRKLLDLVAPVSGRVQNLSIHTAGGVVTTAETLMEIVPKESIEVEAAVSNKDIGFVVEGQEAIVKITTFPYTRYGYLRGKVLRVSDDTTQDKKLGAVYLVRISLPSDHFRVDRRWVRLAPGMEVTTEILTGTQRVWQYFLQPVLETTQESLRER
jgi:hemolysin D